MPAKRKAVSLVREVKPAKPVVLADISSIVPDASQPIIRYDRDNDIFVSFDSVEDATGVNMDDCDGYENISNIFSDIDFDFNAEDAVATTAKLMATLAELITKTK